MSGAKALYALLLSVMWVTCACAAAPVIRIDSRPELLSFDGLAPVLEPEYFDRVWIRPSAKLGQYKKLMLQGDGVQYRYVSADDPRMALQMPITESSQSRFEASLSRAFNEELVKSKRFEITLQAGRGVATLWGALVDVNLRESEKNQPQNLALEFTLVLEVRDSITESTLVRAVETRHLNIRTGAAATDWSEISSSIRSIAVLIRERLDALGSRFSVKRVRS